MTRTSLQLGSLLTLAVIVLVDSPAAAYPPLTESQRIRLESAYDGRDHQEEAFVALAENVRQWDGVLGDVPVRLTPDLAMLTEHPDAARGAICRLSGILSQQTRLASPYEYACEWFIRAEDGAPFIVYIIDADRGEDARGEFRDGQPVEIIARFYKRVDFSARDGRDRGYAAFVGAHPRLLPLAAPSAVSPLIAVAAPVAGLIIVFGLLFFYVRQQRRRPVSRRWGAIDDALPVDDGRDLPDDPADALKALHDRATDPPNGGTVTNT